MENRLQAINIFLWLAGCTGNLLRTQLRKRLKNDLIEMRVP